MQDEHSVKHPRLTPEVCTFFVAYVIYCVLCRAIMHIIFCDSLISLLIIPTRLFWHLSKICQPISSGKSIEECSDFTNWWRRWCTESGKKTVMLVLIFLFFGSKYRIYLKQIINGSNKCPIFSYKQIPSQSHLSVANPYMPLISIRN